MPDADPWPLDVFYDGACPLCTRKAAAYRLRDRFHRIRWINIAQPGFDPAAWGLDPARLQQMMHARTADGRVFTATSAFVKIWEALPSTPLTAALRALLKIPGMVGLANLFYRFVAQNRYRLTGRCSPESCPTDQ